MKVRKVWQPECETAGHVTSAKGKPRDMMVVLSSHAPAHSVTDTCRGMVPPTLKVPSSANPVQEHWKLCPMSTISVSHPTQVGQCLVVTNSKCFWWGLVRPVDSNSRIQTVGHCG